MPREDGYFKKGNQAAKKTRTVEQLACEEMGRNALVKYGFPELVSIVRNRAQYPKLWQWAVEKLIDQCLMPQPRETNLDASISGGVGATPGELAGEITAIIPGELDKGSGGDIPSGQPVEPPAGEVVSAQPGAGEVH